MTVRRAALLTLVIWIVAVAASMALYRERIAALTFPDPDDYLRLLQARDWLDGQGWRDVAQHRINPEASAPMHWTRLADLPIAGVIALAEPLVGRDGATRLAGVVVPALSLGVIMAQVALITGRLVCVAWAPVGALVAGFSSLLHVQTSPLRVDHHAWQIIAALLAFQALLDDRRPGRSGATAGAACALWIHVSVEGVPMTAAIGALLGLRWTLVETERDRLASFLGALFAASVALALANGGVPALVVTHCDQISAPYLAGFATLALLAAAATFGRAALSGVGHVTRLGLGGAALAAALAAYLAVGPRCVAGPLDMIDAALREHWLQNVNESEPVFEASPAAALAALLPLAFGIIGAATAAATRDRRPWTSALWLLATATLLSLSVHRAAGVAQALAAPGATFLTMRVLTRASLPGSGWLRIPAAASALVVATPIVATPLLAVFLAVSFFPPVAPIADGGDAVVTDMDPCFEGAAWAALRGAPASRLLAPLDIGPRILFDSPHSVLATGHHRNAPAMSDVVRALRGSETVARAVMTRHRLTHVVFCPDLPETHRVALAAPDGFLAALVRDRPPDWLEPVAPFRSGEMRVYRLRDSPPRFEARAARD